MEKPILSTSEESEAYQIKNQEHVGDLFDCKLLFISSLFFPAKRLTSIATRSISDVWGSESSENGMVAEPRLVDST